jgi:MFS family permease
MLTGSMADRFGRKRLFLVGLSGFSLGFVTTSARALAAAHVDGA